MSHRMLLLGAVAALAIAPASALADGPPSGTIAFAQTFGTTPTMVVEPHGFDPKNPLKARGTKGIYPALSPDGKTLAYIDDDALKTTPVNRRKPTQVAPASLGVAAPAWSPDGRQLSYVLKGDLMLVNASGGSPRRVVNGSGD